MNQTNPRGGLVVQTYVLSRAVIAIVLVALMIVTGQPATQLISQWDVVHFIAISQSGYTTPDSPAFFPGLPLLLHAGALVGIPEVWTGVIVGLICSALAAAALYKLFGAPAACLWLLAPTAVFTVVGYSEAPFCAAAFWAWQRARQGHWGQAALLAAVACTFRISGLFLLAGLFVLAWEGGRGLFGRLFSLLLPAGVLGGYLVYLHQVTGSWLAWWTAQQSGWERSFATPWQSLLHTLQASRIADWPGRPEVAWLFRAEIVALALGLVATIFVLARRHFGDATYIGLQVVVFGTSYWYMSVVRALLVWFPLWGAIGGAGLWRPQSSKAAHVAAGVIAVVSGALMVVWAWLFFTGRWAG